MSAHMSTHVSTRMPIHRYEECNWPLYTRAVECIEAFDRCCHTTSLDSTDMCVDMCVDICVDMRVDMCADMGVDVCADMCIDIVQTCVETCVQTCV